MSYLKFISFCLSISSNIFAVQSIVHKMHVCPMTGIVLEEHAELIMWIHHA